jgi:hypothetical protein
MRRSTRMAQQQGTVYHQLTLFEEPDGDAVCHDLARNGATEPTGSLHEGKPEPRLPTRALQQGRAGN